MCGYSILSTLLKEPKQSPKTWEAESLSVVHVHTGWWAVYMECAHKILKADNSHIYMVAQEETQERDEQRQATVRNPSGLAEVRPHYRG